jgi:hypothetical protein
MGVDDVKYGVMFNCVFVIDVIVIPCFSVSVEFFNCIHVFSLLIIVRKVGSEARFAYVKLVIVKSVLYTFNRKIDRFVQCISFDNQGR